MNTIWYALVSSYATLATVPIIPFLIVYYVSSIRGGDRKKAMQFAMDVTGAFLIGCVAMLINRLLNTEFGLFFLVLVMLICGGLIGNAQNRVRGKVDTKKLIRAVWRLSFFGLTFLYVVLMPVDLILYFSSH